MHKLIGKNPLTFLVIIGLVVFQIIFCWLVAD